MCKKQQNIISKNVNGQLSYCKDCKVFDLTFNNILIELTPRELISFQNVLIAIENLMMNARNNNFHKKDFPSNYVLILNN